MALLVRACALVALSLAAAPLRARGEDEPARPPSFGEELTVVGSRPRTAAADPTAAATVVDAGRFAGETKTVAELVATAPGVAVSQYGGLGQLATVSIRGSTADQVPIFLDGLPLLTGAGGGVDLSRIPRAWIDRIEVVRGAEGAVYGAGALGGALNIVTRPAARGGWSFEGGGGSFGYGTGAVEVSGGGDRAEGLLLASGEGWQGRYTFDAQRTPNLPTPPEAVEQRHNAWLSGALLAKGALRLGEDDLDAALQLSAGRREIPGYAYGFTQSTEVQRDGRAGGVVRWTRPLSTDVVVTVDARLREDALDLETAAVRQRDLTGGGTAAARWTVGPHALSVAASADGERLSGGGTGTHARAALAATVADDARLGDRLRVTPALRLERVGPFDGWSAKLGAVLRLAGPLSARASGARSFRPPSFSELFLQQALVTPNPDLHPERAWSADAGLVLDRAPVSLAATGFVTRYEDVITYEPASFGRFKPLNVGEAAAWGAEAEAALAPVGRAGLSAQAAYTFLATRTLAGSRQGEGYELPRRARHRAYGRVAVEPGPAGLHVDLQYVGAQWNDALNRQSIAPIALVGAGAWVRLVRRPEVRLQLEVRNLLDDRSLLDAFLNPLPGRMVILTLRVAGGKDAT